MQDKRCQVTSVPGRVPDLQEAALGDGQESIVGGKHGSFHGRLKVEAVQAETPGDADDHNPALSVERQEKRPRPVCAKPADVTSALNRKGVRGVVGELKDRNAIANSTKEEFVAVGPPIGMAHVEARVWAGWRLFMFSQLPSFVTSYSTQTPSFSIFLLRSLTRW